MVKFIIARHGYSIYNKEKRFTGQIDIPLDKIGERQAELIADYVTKNFKVDAIYSSDLDRAVMTAMPTAKRLSLPITQRRDLREINEGCWQGMKFDEVRKIYSRELLEWEMSDGSVKAGGGESYNELRARMCAGLQRIAEENDGKTVLIITHGGALKALLLGWTNTPASNLRSLPIVSLLPQAKM